MSVDGTVGEKVGEHPPSVLCELPRHTEVLGADAQRRFKTVNTTGVVSSLELGQRAHRPFFGEPFGHTFGLAGVRELAHSAVGALVLAVDDSLELCINRGAIHVG